MGLGSRDRLAPGENGSAPHAPPGRQETDDSGGFAAELVGQGTMAGRRFTLEQGETIVGRSEDCHVQVPDPLASRRHAVIRREPWRYLLEDLGSTNGTLVNGELLTGPHQLQNGDTILIAATPLRFEDPNATVPVARESLRLAHLPVVVNESAGEAYTFGQRLDLAPKEFALLALLYRRGGDICEKDEIAGGVWPEYGGVVSDYNIETLVSRLRHKLEACGVPDTIVNVKKRGYRLRIDE